MERAQLLDYENKNIILEDLPQIVTETLSDDEINEKYLRGEIRIVTEQARYPLNSIPGMFSSDEYILNPNFQRRHRWDRTKQSRLIESFIINIPIPPIFLYETDFSVYEVMDGLQRITAIKEFYENKFSLEGLEKWPELNGRNYSSLPEQIRKGIDRRYLSSVILLRETAKTEAEALTLKQLVFARINSGGAKLEDQESRNAQFQGAFNNMIIELARESVFCDIFDIPQKTDDENLSQDSISDELKANSKFRSMKDAEIVLRFFAFRKLDSWTSGSLSNFLDRYSKAVMNIGIDVLNLYRNIYIQTLRLAYDIYGEHTFCMWRENKISGKLTWSKNPTMVIYDPMMCALSAYIDNAPILVEKRDEIVARTQTLFSSDDDFKSGRNTSSSNIRQRIQSLDSLFKDFLSL